MIQIYYINFNSNLAEIKIILHMSFAHPEMSVEAVLGEVPLRSSHRVSSDKPDDGLLVEAGELLVAAPAHQDEGFAVTRKSAGCAHKLPHTAGEETDETGDLRTAQTGVVEQHDTAVLQVVLPPLHRTITRKCFFYIKC